MSDFEIVFLQAEADGIAPALLLRVGGARGAQYIVNVPEGFSRLVLEHQVRPGANLRAIFGMHASPEGLGGLAGLLMRLRQDGHGEVHLIGPPGTKEAINGLQRFVTWRHPRVHLSQTQPGLPPHIYQDGHVQVAALWGAPLCWTPPEWLQPAGPASEPHAPSSECDRCPPTGTREASSGKQEGSERSTESSSDGDGACEPGSGMPAKARGSEAVQGGHSETSSSESSSEDESGSRGMEAAQEQSSSPEVSVEEEAGREQAGREASSIPAQSKFEDLDRLFSSGGARTTVFQILGAKRPVCNAPALDIMPGKRRKSSAAGDVASSVGLEIATSGVPGHQGRSFATDGSAGSKGMETNQVPGWQSNGSAAKGGGGFSGDERDGWLQLPGSANPVFVRSKVTSTAVPRVDRLWGLLIRITATGQLLLVVLCPNAAALAMLRRHPVFQQPGLDMLALVVHLTPKRVADSAAYKRWVAQLPGKQVMMHGGPKELGYLASARTLARLNTTSSALFPIPPSLANTGQRPRPQSCGRTINARLLMRVVGSANDVTFDCEGCPSHPDIGALQKELLEKRPELSSLAASLASSTLASQPTSHTPPQPLPLPDSPAMIHRTAGAAQQLGTQHLGAQQLGTHRFEAEQSGCNRSGWMNWGGGQCEKQSPRGYGTPAWQTRVGPHSSPAQQGRNPRQPPAVMAAGQYAQVLQFGRPVGIVQLTPQGWVSPQGLQHSNPAGAPPLPAGQPPSLLPPNVREPRPPKGVVYRPLADTMAGPEERLQARNAHRWDAEDIELPESPLAQGGAAAEEASTPGVKDLEAVPQCLLDAVARADPTQITFLGTGSAEPSKYRGSSAIHVQLECGYGVLLDAGEGAWGQMVRCYGRKGAAKQVAQLAAVWVSHKHADHMLGLPAILQARPAAAVPLLVVGPAAAAKWLSEICGTQQLHYRFLACKDCCTWEHPEHQWLLHALGLTEWTAVPVDHCHDAWALILEHRTGWSLTYSGDSRPCQRLIEAAQGSTLLIHEATFEPCLVEQAVLKRHSTSEEALRVAADCGAYRTVLTHFSQRYPKLPPSLAGPLTSGAAVAFDGMRVALCALPDLPRVMPVLQHALEDPEESNPGSGEGLPEDLDQVDPERRELENWRSHPPDPDMIEPAGGLGTQGEVEDGDSLPERPDEIKAEEGVPELHAPRGSAFLGVAAGAQQMQQQKHIRFED